MNDRKPIFEYECVACGLPLLDNSIPDRACSCGCDLFVLSFGEED